MCWLFWNLGATNSWNPQCLSRPVVGLLYLYLLLPGNRLLPSLSIYPPTHPPVDTCPCTTTQQFTHYIRVENLHFVSLRRAHKFCLLKRITQIKCVVIHIGGPQRVIWLQRRSWNTIWRCLRDCVLQQCSCCVASLSENRCPWCLPELLQTQFTRKWCDREHIYTGCSPQ